MAGTRSKLNMSTFLADINSSPTASDSKDDFTQLDLFANTDFFNFDMGEPLAEGVEMNQQSQPSWSGLEGDFQFNSVSLSTLPNDANSPSSTFPIDPLFTSGQSQSIASAQINAKRKFDVLADPNLPPSERARVEAEEDKRRRNTAASARFRVKKKQREQALEKTAKEMTDKANNLEKRVHELELENKWLKGLITEKTSGQEFSDLFAKFLSDNNNNEGDVKVHEDGLAS